MEKDAEGFYTPAADSKPEAPPEQDNSEYPDSFGGWMGSHKSRPGEVLIRHKSTIQKQIQGQILSSPRSMLLYVASSFFVCELFLTENGWTGLFGFLSGYGRRPTTGPKFAVVQRQDV